MPDPDLTGRQRHPFIEILHGPLLLSGHPRNDAGYRRLPALELEATILMHSQKNLPRADGFLGIHCRDIEPVRRRRGFHVHMGSVDNHTPHKLVIVSRVQFVRNAHPSFIRWQEDLVLNPCRSHPRLPSIPTVPLEEERWDRHSRG